MLFLKPFFTTFPAQDGPGASKWRWHFLQTPLGTPPRASRRDFRALQITKNLYFWFYKGPRTNSCTLFWGMYPPVSLLSVKNTSKKVPKWLRNPSKNASRKLPHSTPKRPPTSTKLHPESPSTRNLRDSIQRSFRACALLSAFLFHNGSKKLRTLYIRLYKAVQRLRVGGLRGALEEIDIYIYNRERQIDK